MTYPLAIDYRFPLTQERHAIPLPPIPEGWTRLLAADYADGDEYTYITPVEQTREVEATRAEDGTILTPAFTEKVTVSAGRHEQVASGAVKEHARRAAEWAANQPPAPPAPVPVPQEVTNRAFRLALRAVTGIKPSAVTVALSAIPDDGAREDALSEWEYANTIARSNQLLPAIAAHFGVSDSLIDSIFSEAAKL